MRHAEAILSWLWAVLALAAFLYQFRSLIGPILARVGLA
ncbi:hypothetical protein CCC_00861 [Paramagnetospirillum magnetotacticum MS-1]|uniref:Uncharacterized protein n=1 Tax=Paramagnetospirillum magnetotacticum MS-1 TaxID=272627 RepID=A0A0C2YSV3_PARME|nr:hypothetical protein CCC_00861 [Paramagnetospirillum magnetotacticum MS-1]